MDVTVSSAEIRLREPPPGTFGVTYGVYVWREGIEGIDVGPVTVAVTDTEIESAAGHGIHVDHGGEGIANSSIIVDGGGFGYIEVTRRSAYGIRGYRDGHGDVIINVRDHRINTAGDRAHGISAYHTLGGGNIDIDVDGGSITTEGELAPAIRPRHQTAMDENGDPVNGDITVDLKNLTITTKGVSANGIESVHENKGDNVIQPQDVTIKTESTGIYRDIGILSKGIYGTHTGVGDIIISPRGGSITTLGSYSYGIEGRHSGDGNISITTDSNHTITTRGDNAHGIVAYHFGNHGPQDHGGNG